MLYTRYKKQISAPRSRQFLGLANLVDNNSITRYTTYLWRRPIHFTGKLSRKISVLIVSYCTLHTKFYSDPIRFDYLSCIGSIIQNIRIRSSFKMHMKNSRCILKTKYQVKMVQRGGRAMTNFHFFCPKNPVLLERRGSENKD